jgi:hypothetical protein
MSESGRLYPFDDPEIEVLRVGDRLVLAESRKPE